MPRGDVVKDGIYHICTQGMLEGQKKRERIDLESTEFVDVVNGQAPKVDPRMQNSSVTH